MVGKLLRMMAFLMVCLPVGGPAAATSGNLPRHGVAAETWLGHPLFLLSILFLLLMLSYADRRR